MGLHARHHVGRAFHGEEARKLLAAHKRDSHGTDLKMHVPEGYDAKVLNNAVETATADDVQTAVSVVYVTLPQTFEGSASYLTMTDAGSSSSAAQQMEATALQSPARASATSSASLNDDEASYAAARSSANAITTASAAAATITASSTLATSFAAAQLGAETTQSSNTATRMGGTPVQATHSASSTAGAIEQTSSGMSGGAKAGLAFGIILALALAFGLVFFCWRRKKNTKDQEEVFDEKHGSFVDASARRIESENNNRGSVMSEKVPASIRSTRTASTAPRLSLRPVTQFLPNLVGTAAAASTSERPKSAWERKPANAQDNPFDDAPVLSEKDARPVSPPSNPFEEGDTPVAAAAAATDKKHSPKSSWEGSEPATPKSTKFGTAAAVPVVAAGNGKSPAPRGPNNVHRVQLDFKPSMEDELELRSGQLVRMLHEYDDGWALCIRMDRSQQGVAPRTCLSKLPVKPRPQGPPPQGSRPGTAQSHSSNGSLSSNGSAPRPLTPQTNRPQSPSPASVPARKPVPGQAM